MTDEKNAGDKPLNPPPPPTPPPPPRVPEENRVPRRRPEPEWCIEAEVGPEDVG